MLAAMRLTLILIALLAACAPAPPEAPLAGREPVMAEMTYHCTEQGNLVVRWDFPEGGFEESMTGDRCDYEAWRADVAANGPVYSRRSRLGPSYDEWMRAREGKA